MKELNLQAINKLFNVLAVLFFSFNSSFAQLGDNMLTSRINVDKSSIKRTDVATVSVYIKNPFVNETIELKATATYKIGDEESTAESNVVYIVVDRSIYANVVVNIGKLTYVNDSATYDNVSIKPVYSNSLLRFNNLLVPGDNLEHVIVFKIKGY